MTDTLETLQRDRRDAIAVALELAGQLTVARVEIAKLRARDAQGLRLRGALVAVERSKSLEMAQAAATAALNQDTEFRANGG